MEELQKKKIIETFEISDVYPLIAEPIKDEINKLKYAYEVSGEKAAELRGLYNGLNFLFDLIEMYKRQGEVVQSPSMFQDIPEENKLI